jgi:hypothetical protein
MLEKEILPQIETCADSMNDGKERTLKTSGPTAWTAMD